MRVGREMRRLRMRWFAIEDVRNGLSFVGRQSRNEHQSLDAIVRSRPDDSARISVCRKDDRTADPLERLDASVEVAVSLVIGSCTLR